MEDHEKSPSLGAEAELQPGEELLAALHSLLQNVKFHQENNILVINCIKRIMTATGKFFEEADDLSIQLAKGQFYINDEKLLHRRTSAFLVENMLKFMESRGVMGLRFYPAMLVAPSEQVVALARHLNAAVRQKNPMDWLILRLEEEKLNWVALLQPEALDSVDVAAGIGSGGKGGHPAGRDVNPGRQVGGHATGAATPGVGPDGGGEGGDSTGTGRDGGVGPGGVGVPAGSGSGAGVPEVAGRRSPRRLYAYALEAMREVAEKISGNQRSGVRNAVRIVQNMVEEIIIQEHPLLLAMSTIRVYDDYTFSHSVNVAILSMFLGKKIGVGKETMELLGISGLFHDLGKVLVPVEIFNKQGTLTEEEFGEIRKHSLNSARLILRLRASAKRKAGIIMPPLEHHLRYDLKGYPEIGWEKPQTICGRILTICDCFDALTSPRVYRQKAYSADQALGMMLQQSGTVFDPLLLKVFVNILGVYPIGTLLELDNGDIGLVCRSPETKVMSRPWVLLLNSDGQGGFVKGEEVNLAAKDQVGHYFRSVTGSANPAIFNIQPAEFLT
jgi:HD-GYP domain-containing protein (c-di-GMP phosphodiesterase class II)